jgi:oligopeptide transport system permease protein
MYTHVLRNASVPLVRNIPATLLSAMIGSYFVEKIWSIPGTGKMLINALYSTDVSAIQGLTFLYSAISMLAFLLGDLVTVAFDPRIKLQG